MKTSTILRRAKKLISDPSHHLGGDGKPNRDASIGPASKYGDDINPTCRCLMIAVRDSLPGWDNTYETDEWGYLDNVAFDIFGLSAVRMNDRHGYDAAHIILDEAIARARKAGD